MPLRETSRSLSTYAAAWLAEHQYVERAARADRALCHTLNTSPRVCDPEWEALLAAKEQAFAVLGMRDYTEAQAAIYEAMTRA